MDAEKTQRISMRASQDTVKMLDDITSKMEEESGWKITKTQVIENLIEQKYIELFDNRK